MPTARPARILIIDDEPGVRALLLRALQHAGYEVTAMNDGAAGLNAATTATTPFDLIVTNNYMPHLSGAELVAELRRQFPHQPILHLDDLSHPQRLELPDDVPNLYKPFSVDRLLEAVEQLLAERPGGVQ
jgi:CheY-like chemotaxis protein